MSPSLFQAWIVINARQIRVNKYIASECCLTEDAT